MKKILYSILTLVLLSGVIISCSGDSYQKRIDKEKKSIKRFLSDNEISVTTVYPGNVVFPENLYYLEEGTGIYFRVINPGNLSNVPDSGKLQLMALRTDSVEFLVSGTLEDGNDYPTANNISFTYGNPSTYTGSQSVSVLDYWYMSPALVLPLRKGIGYGAEISLIVPFMNGSGYQKYYYEPFFFRKVTYRFQKQVEEENDKTEK